MSIRGLIAGIVSVSLVAGQAWAKPEWVEKNTSKKHPPEKFFIGVGSSPDESSAKDKARAEIAKILKSKVEQVQQDKETYASQTTGKKTSTQQTFEASSATKVKVEETLEGVEIVETYKDDNIVWALASLDREKTAADLRKKATDLDLQGDELLKAANTENKLQKAKGLYSAWEKFAKADGYSSQLAVVSPTGTGVVYRAGETRIKRDKALADVKFRVDVKGEGLADVIKTINQALTGIGFSGVSAGQKEDLLVQGELEVNEFDRGTPTKFAKWGLRIEIMDNATGEAVGTLSKVGDEGSNTFDLARQRAIVKIRGLVQSEFDSLLKTSILGAAQEIK
ncbi:MAG: LPP20 family lipoprotein [Nitrospirae bacterium]|nr:LPP20 family lipoprotein [Nitrospirota bacterium]